MHADAFYNLRKIRNGSGVRNRWPEPETYKTSAVRGGWDRNRNSKTRETQRQRESALQVRSVRGEDPKLASIFHIRTKASTYLRLTQFTDRFTLIVTLLPEPRVVPTPPIELDSATAPATVDLVRRDAERPFVGFQCEAALGFGAGGFLRGGRGGGGRAVHGQGHGWRCGWGAARATHARNWTRVAALCRGALGR